MRRLLPPLAAVVLLAPAAAGCSDDSDGDTTTTSAASISKQQFIRDANKICRQSDNKIKRASQQFFADAPPNQEPAPSEVEEFGEKTVYPTIQDQIDRISALGAPEGDEDQVQAILDAAQKGLDELRQNPRQLAKGGAAPAFEQAQKLAGDYGLDQCAAG